MDEEIVGDLIGAMVAETMLPSRVEDHGIFNPYC